jgi:perosamine synthetase
MLPSHPTLRFRDIARRRAHSLKSTNAPNPLHLTYNARGAFYQLLRSLPESGGRTVLLPAFHCTALVEPVARAGFKAKFYRVRPDFSVDFVDVGEKMSSDVAVLLAIHYFGFPAEMRPFCDLASRHNSYVVEDCAHSFLSRQGETYVGHRGDFALFSYYKFAPSLAGGGLGTNVPEFATKLATGVLPLRDRIVIAKRLFERVLENSPRNPVSRILLALERRRVSQKPPLAMNTGSSQFVDDPYLFREDLALAGMPGLCRRVLESCNWEEMVITRKRNYQLFGKLIRDTRLMRLPFPDLPDNVCPWAFPILLEERLLHEQSLRALDVPLFTFGEILHPLLEATRDDARKDAEYLSRRLMLLPVHSQLQEEDVYRLAEIINRFVGKLEQPGDGTVQVDRPQDRGTALFREGNNS